MEAPKERRVAPRKQVLMAATIEFAGDTISCVVCNMSISGAALDVPMSVGIPEKFMLVFKTGNAPIPCHVVWREDKRIGVTFD
jgi:PilZ domain